MDFPLLHLSEVLENILLWPRMSSWHFASALVLYHACQHDISVESSSAQGYLTISIIDLIGRFCDDRIMIMILCRVVLVNIL